MVSVTIVYMLDKFADDSRFQGWAVDTTDLPSLIGNRSLQDDIAPSNIRELGGHNYQFPGLKHAWRPQRAYGECAPFNDYPCVNLIQPAFSRKAVDALGEYLTDNGELLPLATPHGEYFLFHILTLVPMVREDSKINWLSGKIVGSSADYFVFDPEVVRHATIFRPRQVPSNVMVTQPFVDRVHAAGLLGFEFRKVWPLPPGVDYYMEHKRLNRERREQDAKLKQHSVILHFQMAGKTQTQAEKSAFASIVNEINCRLQVSSLEQPFYGRWEVKGQRQGAKHLTLSCPDADRLLAFLTPYLLACEWPGAIQATKRSFHYQDEDGEQQIVSVRN